MKKSADDINACNISQGAKSTHTYKITILVKYTFKHKDLDTDSPF